MILDFLQKRTQPLSHWLWSRDAMRGSRLQSFFVRALRIGIAVLRDLSDGHLSLRAMSLVYTTVIAIVPVIALSFSVLKGFGMHHRVEPAMLDTLVDLGDQRFEIVEKIMQFIGNVNVGVLGSIGFAILIYSVISMMQKIETAFNYTWQIKRARDMSQRFRDYLSVIFVGPLLIFLSAAITTSVNTTVAEQYFVVLPYGDQIMALSGYLLPYLMMSAGFAFIYAYLPNTKVSIASAFVGGLVTAIIWKIMGWGIANFVANSATSMAIYSAFASIIILMVWIYLGWLVLLIGASVSFYHQNPQNLRVRREQISLSAKNNEKLAVNILCLVGDSYRKSSCPWDAQRLSEHMSVGLYLVEDMIDMLEKTGYLIRAAGDAGELFPRKPLDSFSLSDLIRTIRSGNSIGGALSPADFDQRVDDFFEELDGATARALEHKTIKDLLS